MKYLAVLVIAVCAFAPAFAQEIDCTEEFFRVSRREGSCQDFFVCMVGGRVDFSCDDGEIFDEDRITCRPGNPDSCEFIIPEIPADACQNEFLRISPHPDPDNCIDFFVCMNFNLVVFRCEYGQIFNRNTNRCVPGNRDTCRPSDVQPYEIFMQNVVAKSVKRV